MTKEIRPWSIHWFRRDLRVAGNPAMRRLHKLSDGRVLGIFFFDKKFLSRPDFSHDRFQFFLESLKKLKDELQGTGGDLLVLDTGPDLGFETLFSCCKEVNQSLPFCVGWNRDYEPFARDRDNRLTHFLRKQGIETLTERDHLIIEPDEILNQQDQPFKVYSAYAKKWFEKVKEAPFEQRFKDQKSGLLYLETKDKSRDLFRLSWKDIFGDKQPRDCLDEFIKQNKKSVSIAIPPAGSETGWNTIKAWGKNLARYQDARDFPAISGTSKFSLFLKNGSITTSQIIAAYELFGLDFKGGDSATKFLKELVWREFYYYLLWHFPHVENSSFQEKFNSISWENNQEWFEAWKNGQTGFPIVDAAMRELLTTGWMHNRSRMIVASFLTKDLLIDWKFGEQWLMNKLLDGDLAPNNGGWQWAAGTGCDAQPYFRIFNPLSQSQKFDANGDYIRKHIPELCELPAKEIHDPSPELRRKAGYAHPVVNHKVQREKALKLYAINKS